MLLVDIGNSRVKWATYDHGQLGPQSASAYSNWTMDDWRRALFQAPGIDNVLVASVAGEASAALLTEAARLGAEGTAYALATVVGVRRPASARTGNQAIVTADGAIDGWVGGACSEPVVIREALRSLADGQPRLWCRAGVHLGTSHIEDEAGNFGFDRHPDHANRYERAEEFFDVCAGLWDSFEDGAFIRDKASGRYIDPSKGHILNHQGEFFRVRGPLNLPRTPQGRPVIAQAGSSGDGRKLASRVADMIFTAQSVLSEGKSFYDDLKSRAAAHGRDPDHVKIMPGFMTILGETKDEAEQIAGELGDMMDEANAMRLLARLCGDLDIHVYPVDGPLPDLPPSADSRLALLATCGSAAAPLLLLLLGPLPDGPASAAAASASAASCAHCISHSVQQAAGGSSRRSITTTILRGGREDARQIGSRAADAT